MLLTMDGIVNKTDRHVYSVRVHSVCMMYWGNAEFTLTHTLYMYSTYSRTQNARHSMPSSESKETWSIKRLNFR